jgi:hypothetical protein
MSSSSELAHLPISFYYPGSNISFNLPETHPNRVSLCGVDKRMRTLRVYVRNRKLDRNKFPMPAFDCVPVIEIFTPKGDVVVSGLRAGWAGLDSRIITTSTRQHETEIGNGFVESLNKNIDVHRAFSPLSLFPGEGRYIDIACRLEGEKDAFLWSDTAYYQVVGNYFSYIIEPGEFLVRLSVYCEQNDRYTIFKLINTEDVFVGIPATTEEIFLLTLVED